MSAGHSLAEQYAERVEALVDELVRIIVATTDDHWTRRVSDQAWSPAETCGHIAEMLPFWAAAAAEVAANPRMAFGRDEQDPRRVDGVIAGAATGRHEAVEQIRAAANAACRHLRAIPDNGWSVQGVSVTRGPMTVEEIASTLLVGHLESHVEQVREASGAL